MIILQDSSLRLAGLARGGASQSRSSSLLSGEIMVMMMMMTMMLVIMVMVMMMMRRRRVRAMSLLFLVTCI